MKSEGRNKRGCSIWDPNEQLFYITNSHTITEWDQDLSVHSLVYLIVSVTSDDEIIVVNVVLLERILGRILKLFSASQCTQMSLTHTIESQSINHVSPLSCYTILQS